MKAVNTIGIVVIGSVALMALNACGGRYRSFDEVEKHLDNPTGEINASNMKAAVTTNADSNGDAISTGTGQIGALPSFAWGTTAGGQTLYAPARLRRFLPRTLPAGIANIAGAGCDELAGIGSVDVEMELDMSTISAGEVTGTFKYAIKYDDVCHFEIEITMDNVCDTISNECVDGGMGFLSEFDSMSFLTSDVEGKLISSGNVHFTDDVDDITLEWGLRVVYSSSNAAGSVEFLAFVDVNGDAESIVIEAKYLQGDGSVSVRGSNGSWTCTYTNDGEAGTCTVTDGSSTADVTWTS